MHYVALTRVMDDVGTTMACQGLLRSALHGPEWTVLWPTGRMDIVIDDDIDGIVEKLGRYCCVNTSYVANKSFVR